MADSDRGETSGAGGDDDSRTVVVPLRLYKTVTVFSTLIAIALILAGFILLDRATLKATADAGEVNAWLALFALGLLLAGAVVYAFATRFRTAGMGKPKDETDERPDDG